ncbi:MAG TPA: hypothetical protein GXX39_04560 [Syntrophothermus lipocalidus]|nr:hypothetical protein [Syntrophothermus lipocalidus]
MRGFNRQAWAVAMGYIGAVVGAGFASGQEIVQFFVVFDRYGLYGVLLSGALFAAMGALLFYICHRSRINGYQRVIRTLFGPRWGKLTDTLFSLFLFLGVCTMFSASGAVFYEHLYLNKTLGIGLTYLATILLLAGGVRGLVFSYNLLVPIKILLLLSIAGCGAFGMKNYAQIPAAYAPLFGYQYWAMAAVLYVAYNFALATAVLPEYQPLVNMRNGTAGAIGGGLGLGLMLCIYYLALSNFSPAVLHYEVPMLLIAGQVGTGAKLAYVCVLWIGILTTALANGYGLAQRVSDLTGIPYSASLCLIMTAALPLSFRSFASLVGTVYPLFGLLGISIMGGVIYRFVKVLSSPDIQKG